MPLVDSADVVEQVKDLLIRAAQAQLAHVKLTVVDVDVVHLFIDADCVGRDEVMTLAVLIAKADVLECEIEDDHVALYWD